jgi:hypothetical protein
VDKKNLTKKLKEEMNCCLIITRQEKLHTLLRYHARKNMLQVERYASVTHEHFGQICLILPKTIFQLLGHSRQFSPLSFNIQHTIVC